MLTRWEVTTTSSPENLGKGARETYIWAHDLRMGQEIVLKIFIRKDLTELVLEHTSL